MVSMQLIFLGEISRLRMESELGTLCNRSVTGAKGEVKKNVPTSLL